MTSTHVIKDYLSTCLKIHTLENIHRETIIDTLLILFRQFQWNAQYMHSKLGGYNHGNLGLVVSEKNCNTINPCNTFICPKHPKSCTLLMVLNNISKICSINSHHIGLHIYMNPITLSTRNIYYFKRTYKCIYIYTISSDK